MRATSHLEWSEFKRLLEHTKKKNKMICLFSAISTYCALRLSDATQLKWGDLKEEMIVIKEKKTDKVREIPMHPDLKELLDELRTPENKDTDYIFANRSGKPLSRVYINYQIKDAFEDAGIKYKGNVSSHLFRKTLCRRILNTQDNKEYALIILMDILKHTRLDITKTYLGLRKEEINKVYLGV